MLKPLRSVEDQRNYYNVVQAEIGHHTGICNAFRGLAFGLAAFLLSPSIENGAVPVAIAGVVSLFSVVLWLLHTKIYQQQKCFFDLTTDIKDGHLEEKNLYNWNLLRYGKRPENRFWQVACSFSVYPVYTMMIVVAWVLWYFI